MYFFSELFLLLKEPLLCGTPVEYFTRLSCAACLDVIIGVAMGDASG